MNRLVALLMSLVFCVSQTVFAQTAQLPASQLTEVERELQWFEDALVELAISQDAMATYEKIQSTLDLLFPNPTRVASIQAEKTKMETSRQDNGRGPFDDQLLSAAFKSFLLNTLVAEYASLRQAQLKSIAETLRTDRASAQAQTRAIILRMEKLSQHEAENPMSWDDVSRVISAIIVATFGAAIAIPGFLMFFVSMMLALSGVGLIIAMPIMGLGFIGMLPGTFLALYGYSKLDGALAHKTAWNWKLSALMDRYKEIMEKAKGLPVDEAYQAVLRP